MWEYHIFLIFTLIINRLNIFTTNAIIIIIHINLEISKNQCLLSLYPFYLTIFYRTQISRTHIEDLGLVCLNLKSSQIQSLL